MVIFLLVLSLILAVIAGIIFSFADDDESTPILVGAMVLGLALACALRAYDLHEDKTMNYETKVPAQIDTTIRINPDKSMDTTYLYHFPKE